MTRRKIAEILDPRDGSVYSVIRTTEQTNPFRVYREWWEESKHRKQIAKYGDLASALYLITDHISRHNTFGL